MIGLNIRRRSGVITLDELVDRKRPLDFQTPVAGISGISPTNAITRTRPML